MTLDHKHLLVNAVVRKPFVDVKETEEWMRRVVEAVGMKLVIGPHAHYCTAEDNNGITAACCIETSHCSLHCWDKTDPSILRFDLYSCATFSPITVLRFIAETDPTEMYWMTVDRNQSCPSLGKQFGGWREIKDFNEEKKKMCPHWDETLLQYCDRVAAEGGG